MKIFTQKIYILFSLLYAIFTIHTAYAEPQVSLSLIPKNPVPYSPLLLRVSSYSFDVNTAMITWKSNNQILESGQGKTEFTLQTGGVGEESIINVVVETKTGIRVEKRIKIIPESVSLIYETPESYIPLFYEGLSLPGEQATIRFTALPYMSDGGSIISPEKISFSWYVNDTLVKKNSGIGKQSAMIPLDMLTEYTSVKVVARSENGSVAEKTIKIYPHKITPLFYTHDEILGTAYNQAYTKRLQTTKDFTISFEPYYLSSKNNTSYDVVTVWTMDGLPITPLGGRLLSMKPKENSYGSKTLSVTVSNTKKRLQKVTSSIALIFDTR